MDRLFGPKIPPVNLPCWPLLMVRYWITTQLLSWSHGSPMSFLAGTVDEPNFACDGMEREIGMPTTCFVLLCTRPPNLSPNLEKVLPCAMHAMVYNLVHCCCASIYTTAQHLPGPCLPQMCWTHKFVWFHHQHGSEKYGLQAVPPSICAWCVNHAHSLDWHQWPQIIAFTATTLGLIITSMIAYQGIPGGKINTKKLPCHSYALFNTIQKMAWLDKGVMLELGTYCDCTLHCCTHPPTSFHLSSSTPSRCISRAVGCWLCYSASSSLK